MNRKLIVFGIFLVFARLISAEINETNLLAQARDALARGEWESVERWFAKTQDTEELLIRGEARRALGYIDLASEDHEMAWRQVAGQEAGLRAQAARVSAETLMSQQRYPEAEQRLNAAVEGASAEETARQALLRARLNAAQAPEDVASIRGAYLRAREQALMAGLKTLAAQIQLELLDLEPQDRVPPVPELAGIAAEISSLPPTPTQAALLMNLAGHALSAHPQPGYLPLARDLVEKAAPYIANGRQRAHFLALRAAILESSGCAAEALIQTSAAIAEAQRIEIGGDFLMQQEWRRGRLYTALGEQDRALDALRRAVFHLQGVRIDIPVEYRAGDSSFRKTLAPLYLQLADGLLRKAAQLSDDAAQPFLRQARDTIEQFKAAEMEDYLGGNCPLETRPIANLEEIAPRTGVLYPIILEDRLELLLGIGERQYRTTVAVRADKIRQTSEQFAELLRPSASELFNPKTLANQLFNWIIAPMQEILEENRVDTLVIIPDGPLRLFPIGALMDSDRFLIERYAVVTAPGLTLFDPQPLARGGGIIALVAGMSKPGPVIDELPRDMVNNLIGEVRGINSRGLIRGLGFDFKQTPTLNAQTLREALRDPKTREKIEDALALPGVEQEVKSVSETLRSAPMLNQEFVLHRFTKEVNRSLRVVHVASHGFFGGSPDNSFFMTYDHLLTMGQLETLLQGNGENEEPPELLTLSACQTAEGNDRAPLGITGVAIKSGARSALGSLWPVSDDATQVLLTEFYRQLRDPRQTKAKAFQKAQLLVLHDTRFQHPFFWSPFILVGNWL